MYDGQLLILRKGIGAIFMLIKKNKTRKLNQKVTWSDNISGWLLILPMVFILYVMIWRPTILNIVWSFFRMRGYTPTVFCGLDNYKAVIENSGFIPMLIVNIKFVFWSLIIGFLPPIFVAIMLNEMVYGKNMLRNIIYLPAVIPGIAGMLIWYYIFYPDQSGLLNMVFGWFGKKPYGWLNEPSFAIIGLIIQATWKGLPGAMLLYYTSLQSVSVELYEAAILDGAGIFKRLWYVTRPQIAGVVLLNFIQQIIGVFQTMEQPLAMTGGGPNGATTTLSLQLYRYGFESGNQGIGQSMALGTIIFGLLLVFTVFYFVINKKIESNY